jgi:AcrR family transcriptional regulator
VADSKAQDSPSIGATERTLNEMRARIARQEFEVGPVDRELADMKQRLIVDRASKVLLEKGFHGTSIRDIATACDMSMGQLYHYISSKDDILYLMNRHSQQMWHQHLADAGLERMTDPVARLEHGMRVSIRYLSDNRGLVQFLRTENKYLSHEHLDKVLELEDQNVVGFYRHLLSEGPGDPEIVQTGLAAGLVAFICSFLSRGWNLHDDDDVDIDAAIDYLTDFVFRGLCIERGPLRSP